MRVIAVSDGRGSHRMLEAHDVFLKSFDPEALGGRGWANLTDEVERAMKFATVAEAMKLWRTQPKRRPYREDGKPNRPLTAYTVNIEEEPVT
jgi:hypothetical protein